MWDVYTESKHGGLRPSDVADVIATTAEIYPAIEDCSWWVARPFDRAVWRFGEYVDRLLSETNPQTSRDKMGRLITTHIPIYSLHDLLFNDFQDTDTPAKTSVSIQRAGRDGKPQVRHA